MEPGRRHDERGSQPHRREHATRLSGYLPASAGRLPITGSPCSLELRTHFPGMRSPFPGMRSPQAGSPATVPGRTLEP
jgi:hypothetical protein